MNRGIVYMLIGSRHAVVTTVSITSLRKWWDGPVVLFCRDEDSQCYGKFIAEDSRLGVEVINFSPTIQKRHTGYAAKPLIPQLSPFEQTIQIDGDTIVVGKLDELWPQNDKEVVLTKFGDWTTKGRIIRNRVSKWLEVAKKEAENSLNNEYPALNTGVLSYNKMSELTAVKWAEMVSRKPT